MRFIAIILICLSSSAYGQRALFFMSSVKPAVVAEPKDIVSVESLTPLSVPFGTSFNSLPLPDEVEVTLDDASTTNVEVTWIEGDYDPETPDTYSLEGTLTLPENITNTLELVAEIDVTVEEEVEEPSPSSITSNHIYNTTTGDRMMLYVPPGYSDNLNLYPLVIFYHGDGQRGAPDDRTYSVGTGNGSQTNWSGTLTNTQRIIHSEFTVEVNSVQVASGYFGVISGTGVSGTYNQNADGSAAYTLSFTTPPSNGHAIVFKYSQTENLDFGPLRFMNEGDEPNVLYVAPQIQREDTGFDTEYDFDYVLEYLEENGYRFDPNRIYITGLSLGCDQIIKLFNDRNPGSSYTWTAFVAAAPGSDTGVPGSSPGTAYTNATNKGKLVVRGTSDGNGTFTGMMANSNGSDREFPVQMLQYWDIGHSTSLWDAKVYNRKNRTDGGGAADFDYIEDFLLLFSLDAEQQAELWVERAEETHDSGDYRVALRQVSNLSNGSFKTALQGRLATVLSAIGRIAVVDIGHASFTSSSPFNNLTSNAASASVSNLIDQSASNTGWTFTCTTPPAGTPATVNNIGSSHRVSGRQFGFQHNTTRDGHEIDAGGTTGTYTFSGLDNGKQYTIKVYAAMGQSSWSNRAEVEVSCGGNTKYAFNDPVNFFASDGAASGAYVVFKNVSPSSNAISFTIKTRQTASTERASYIQVAEIIEQP